MFFPADRGAGKVAGKVLIVDQLYYFFNLLKKPETVIEWCLGHSSTLTGRAALYKQCRHLIVVQQMIARSLVR